MIRLAFGIFKSFDAIKLIFYVSSHPAFILQKSNNQCHKDKIEKESNTNLNIGEKARLDTPEE